MLLYKISRLARSVLLGLFLFCRRPGLVSFCEFQTLERFVEAYTCFHVHITKLTGGGDNAMDADIEEDGGGSGVIGVDGAAFVDLRPLVSLKVVARALAALNVFLCWLRLGPVLSVAPALGLTADTLARAAHGVSGFGLLFLLVFLLMPL